MYPGVWRHGDWLGITERGSASSRAAPTRRSTAGRPHGHERDLRRRRGDARVLDCLVLGLELPDGGYWMPLFVLLRRRRGARRRAERPDQRRRSARSSRRGTCPTRSSPSPGCRTRGPASGWRCRSSGCSRAGPSPRLAGARRDGRSFLSPMASARFSRPAEGPRPRGGVAGILPRWTASTRPRVSSSRSTVPRCPARAASGPPRPLSSATASATRSALPSGDVARPRRDLSGLRSACRPPPRRPDRARHPTRRAACPRPPSTATDHTAEVHTPAVDASVLGHLRDPGARLGAPDRQRSLAATGRHRHGRPRHRDARPARRRPQALPRRIGRGARSPPDRGTRARSGGPGGDRPSSN